MAVQTVTTTRPVALKVEGKVADLNGHAIPERFNQNVSKVDYDHAVALVESKLGDMSLVAAKLTVALSHDHPPLLIDARNCPAVLTTVADDSLGDLDAQVYITPVMVKRLVDGMMDARFALGLDDIFIRTGATRVVIKFVDALTPFNPIHPKLDRLDLKDLPRPTEDISQVKRDLDVWGYGLVKNALSPDELKTLRKRLMDQAKGEADAGIGFFDGGERKSNQGAVGFLTGAEKNPNQRVWCLPNKGKEFIDLLENNKTIDNFVPDFLGDDPILFSYTANIARPGNTPMHMHTDQVTMQPPIRSAAVGMNLMYFLVDVNEQNGGTLVMPGSHKGNWAPDDPFDPVDTVAAAGPAGTCMVFESRLWHATGANRMPQDSESERPVILAFFTRPWMRQQENFSLSVKDEVLETCSDKVKGYLGFKTSSSIGGVQTYRKPGTIVRRPKDDEFIGVLGVNSSSY